MIQLIRLRTALGLVMAVLLGLLLTSCGGGEVEGIQVGAAGPDFTLQAANGEPVTLADYRGQQPVLLFFHMAVG